jgi:hypothetical protein
MTMMMNDVINYLKGLKWYLAFLVMVLSFFLYSQAIGWKWLGATHTTPPAGEQQRGYRYFYHK